MALTVLHCALKLECGIARCIGVLPTANICLSTSSCSRLLSGGCGMCRDFGVSEPARGSNDMKSCRSVTTASADKILELTKSGTNQITVGELRHRFFRSFAHIAGVGAVVFAPA
jgi:hypothetical protein